MKIILFSDSPAAPSEEWKPIPSFPEYSASSWGRITRTVPHPYCRSFGKPFRYAKDKDGYFVLELRKDGKRNSSLRVHRLVAETFLGPRPSGLEINHKDGNKHNNRPENLEYITKRENIEHQNRMGLRAYGERNSMTRYGADTVREIRRLYESGMEQKKIAKQFSISTSGVFGIVHRLTWKTI